MALCLIIQKGFFSVSFFSPWRGSINPRGHLKHMIEGFLKNNYGLFEIINKAQNLNFNQSSLIGCLGLNLDFVIACFAQGGGRMWIPDIGLGGRNIFCDLL